MIWCIMDPKSEFPGGILRFGEYDIKSQHGEIKKKKNTAFVLFELSRVYRQNYVEVT